MATSKKSSNFEYESNIWFVFNTVLSSKCKQSFVFLYFNKTLLDCHSNECFLHPSYLNVRDLLDLSSAEKAAETC